MRDRKALTANASGGRAGTPWKQRQYQWFGTGSVKVTSVETGFEKTKKILYFSLYPYKVSGKGPVIHNVLPLQLREKPSCRDTLVCSEITQYPAEVFPH